MAWSDEFRYRDCPWCGVKDAAMVVHQANITAQGKPGHVRYWGMVSCPRCAGVILIETSAPNQMAALLRTFPEDVSATREVKFLPPEVEKHYKNAIRALDAGLPDATAVQLRKTLEAAADQSASLKSNLSASIKELITKGLITTEFSKALDRVRKVGNLGAHHTDEEIDMDTANQALRFTTQVLRNLFEIPGEIKLLEPQVSEPIQAEETTS